jgi:hypothetical protein
MIKCRNEILWGVFITKREMGKHMWVMGDGLSTYIWNVWQDLSW